MKNDQQKAATCLRRIDSLSDAGRILIQTRIVNLLQNERTRWRKAARQFKDLLDRCE